jgi:hypothetical protein
MKNLLAALIVGTMALPAAAQDFDEEPGPGVARLSLASGDVTVRRGDSGEFIAGERNAPLVALDHVITGPNARAEIQFDWAHMLRLDAESEVRLGALEDGDFFIQLAGGTGTFSVIRESSALAEISTPTVSLRPLRQGAYRVTVRLDGSTQVTVRSGEAEIFTSTGSRVLESGRTMEIAGDPGNPAIQVFASIPADDWDRWNDARDRDLLRSDVYQYVSRDVYGADDLAGHGRWAYDSPYGWVWVPEVASTWAPYRSGRWSWVNYYGWTWVSSDPWGWAPYHYGRWYHAPRYGWVWYPGGVAIPQPWRPALVAFFGWGTGGFNLNVGVSWGFRNLGWVPLAPYEIYRPWYGRGPRTNVTINNVVINNVNIVNNYRNARFVGNRNAVTSVPSADFGRGRVTVNNFVRVNDRDLARAGEVRGRVPLDPAPESRQVSDRPINNGRDTGGRDLARATQNEEQMIRRGARGQAAVAQAGGTSGDRDSNDAVTAAAPGNANPSLRTNPARTNRGTSQPEGATATQAATPSPAPRRAEPAPQVAPTQTQPSANAVRGNAARTARTSTPAATQAAAPSPRRAEPAPQVAPTQTQPSANAVRGNAARTARTSTPAATQATTPSPAPRRAEPAPQVAPTQTQPSANAVRGNAARTARTTSPAASAPAVRRAPEPQSTPQPAGSGPAANNGRSRAAPQAQPQGTASTGNAPGPDSGGGNGQPPNGRAGGRTSR